VRDRAVRATRADRREQVLVEQFLFEVLTFLAGRQAPGGVQRPDHGQSHDHPRSPIPTVDREYLRLFDNPDGLSNILEASACRTWRGATGFDSTPDPEELRGVPVTNPAELYELGELDDETDEL